MKFCIMLLGALVICGSCNGQRLESIISGTKIYVKSKGIIVDSINLFSPRYSKHLTQGNSIYYTDGIVVPDRVTIKLFKVDLGVGGGVRDAVIKSLYLEREQFVDIKLSYEQVVLRFRDEKGRRKVKYKISSLLK